MEWQRGEVSYLESLDPPANRGYRCAALCSRSLVIAGAQLSFKPPTGKPVIFYIGSKLENPWLKQDLPTRFLVEDGSLGRPVAQLATPTAGAVAAPHLLAPSAFTCFAGILLRIQTVHAEYVGPRAAFVLCPATLQPCGCAAAPVPRPSETGTTLSPTLCRTACMRSHERDTMPRRPFPHRSLLFPAVPRS
jgi:hypothetical protein